ECGSGEEALEICCAQPVDLIISDWMMPGMDGPEFCRAFRALPRESYGYFILLTSKSETVEMIHGLDVGADEFLTKPVNSSELRARIASGERILRMEHQLRDKNRQLTDALAELRTLYDALDRDLAEARKLQQSLVPERHRRFGASEVSLLLRPCGHVGGDLVGFFPAGPGEVGLF
ncbi:response regulator, partial [Rhodovulum sulfidophilum]|nr:response regulator [Rhodovulum sulfidophilum]